MSTYSAKPADVSRNWWIIDVQQYELGRVSSKIATMLRGKHKPLFTPHVDMGDFVVIINADKVRLTGNKRKTKPYYRHSGYPGGLKVTYFNKLIDKSVEKVFQHAVWGMLPKNSLGRSMLQRLKVYAGSEHPHTASAA